MMERRRRGAIQEFQNGRYFLYLTRWGATPDGVMERRQEVRIYREDQILVTYSDEVPNNMLDEAIELFAKDPSVFEGTKAAGKTPA